jgi:NTE family protein
MTIRTLVLSGGGGRGAFHTGVYKYLQESGWSPDIIVGTSIGAVNGAAITQGISAAQLEAFWLVLTDADVEGWPPNMSRGTQMVLNQVMRRTIGNPLSEVPADISTAADTNFIPDGLPRQVAGAWSHLLDTGPLGHTLRTKLGLDEAQISASATTLLITATNIRTGEQMLFANKPILDPDGGQPRADVQPGITVQRILASCSIPLVYPWTRDNGEYYWDGALVANSPLGAALDAAQDTPIDQDMEVVVVLMTPYAGNKAEAATKRRQPLPQDFIEAAAYALDWTLLASFRERMKLTKAYNKLARLERLANPEGPFRYRLVHTLVVAPDDLLTIARIIDYDPASSSQLIDLGYGAAAKAFQEKAWLD